MKGALENSVDSDKMLQIAASDQGLLRLHYIWKLLHVYRDNNKLKQTLAKFNELVQFAMIGEYTRHYCCGVKHFLQSVS